MRAIAVVVPSHLVDRVNRMDRGCVVLQLRRKLFAAHEPHFFFVEKDEDERLRSASQFRRVTRDRIYGSHARGIVVGARRDHDRIVVRAENDGLCAPEVAESFA